MTFLCCAAQEQNSSVYCGLPSQTQELCSSPPLLPTETAAQLLHLNLHTMTEHYPAGLAALLHMTQQMEKRDPKWNQTLLALSWVHWGLKTPPVLREGLEVWV